MNSKTTGIWFVIAAALFAFIFVFEHYLRPVVAGPTPLLPYLRPAAVTSVQVFQAGALEIRADRTNGVWFLTRPVSYPAQTAAIGALLVFEINAPHFALERTGRRSSAGFTATAYPSRRWRYRGWTPNRSSR